MPEISIPGILCVFRTRKGKVRGSLAETRLSLQVWAGLGEGCPCVGYGHECEF